jgi:hypothetical protein
MTEPKAPLTLATDPSKINPTGAKPEDLSEYQKSLDAQIKALEQRYANPNYFKVAAGFLKPQLGGFFASLGSASEALGENVEQQRAAELPIAQMRTQLAQSKILTGQNKTQSDEFEAYRASGKPMTPQIAERLISLNPDSQVAKAVKEALESAQKIAQTKSTELGTNISALKASGEDPRMEALANIYATDVPPEKRKAAEAVVFQSRPGNIDPEKWAAMSSYDRSILVGEAAKKDLEKGMAAEDILRQQADKAPDRLGLLRSIRDLSLGVGLADSKTPDGKVVTGQEQIGALLNKFGGNNPMEVFARAAADGKLGETLAGVDQYARQIGMSEAAKDKFQVLVKLLAENQVALRGSSLNPTDAFGELQRSASPNIGNSQRALVTLVDLMGHSEKHAQERYNYAKENKLPYGQLERDRGYNNLRSRYAETHAEIATGSPDMAPPSWYNPSAGNVSKKAEAKPQPAARAPSGGGRERPSERIIGGEVWVRQPNGEYTPKAR